MIRNEGLNNHEKMWIEKMLEKNFIRKREVIEQINQATILREYNDCYISIRFIVPDSLKYDSMRIGVPIEMRVYFEYEVPIQFLLYMKEGKVTELEIFKADSSKLGKSIDLINSKVEIIIDPTWE